jgi:putative ABC transport system ATP-binding protein
MIKLEGVTKTYNSKNNPFDALKNVSVEIEKGEIVAIIGKSGSGKSTLMHLMAGLDTPTNGSMRFKRHDLSDKNSNQLAKIRNESFGFIFQQFFLLPHSSVLDNVTLPLKIAGVSKKKRKEIGINYLKEVDLLDKADNLGSDLSGGQKQRVAIARALVNDPEIVFADEPTGNLDSKNGKQVEELLFSLNKKHGITLVIITHDEELAAKCDRQIQIVDGQIIK